MGSFQGKTLKIKWYIIGEQADLAYLYSNICAIIENDKNISNKKYLLNIMRW